MPVYRKMELYLLFILATRKIPSRGYNEAQGVLTTEYVRVKRGRTLFHGYGLFLLPQTAARHVRESVMTFKLLRKYSPPSTGTKYAGETASSRQEERKKI